MGRIRNKANGIGVYEYPSNHTGVWLLSEFVREVNSALPVGEGFINYAPLDPEGADIEYVILSEFINYAPLDPEGADIEYSINSEFINYAPLDDSTIP